MAWTPKDFKTDRKEANYILTYGLEKSKKLFEKQKQEMFNSLEKYNLNTPDLLKLVNKISDKYNEYIKLIDT